MDKTTPRIRGTTPTASTAAKEPRRNQPPAERVLWDALRGRKLNGLRFRQQHAVGPFVLDFYCPSCKLAIEVDGGIHDEQVEQDEHRDRHLAAYGYRVLRFRNEEVLRDLPSVVDRIAVAANPESTTEFGRPTPDQTGGATSARASVPPRIGVPS